jgi:hypothetical protein
MYDILSACMGVDTPNMAASERPRDCGQRKGSDYEIHYKYVRLHAGTVRLAPCLLTISSRQTGGPRTSRGVKIRKHIDVLFSP